MPEDTGATGTAVDERPEGGPRAAAALLRGGEAPARGAPSKWAVLAIVGMGVFMATLDSSIVNISLPTIARYFGVPLSGEIEWVVIAYLVATAAVLLTAGRLADMLGRKAVWAAGLIVFTAGSALCGVSPVLPFLIGARALQGLGGALIMAVSPAMLTAAFPRSERGRALGLNAITVSLGVSVGPTLGGFITEHFTWRWIFYVNLPIGILALLATFRVLQEPGRRSPGRFDPLGAALLAIGLAALTGGLSFGEELGWTAAPILIALAIGVLALVAVPVVESRVANPIIVLSLLRSRVFTSAIVSLVLSFLALFAVSFLLPFYLEELRGFSPEEAGWLLTPLPLTIAVIAPFSGMLADRIGTRWLAAGGLTLGCAGLVLLSGLDAHSAVLDIIWRLVVIGIGQGLFQSPNNSALLGAAPRGHQGSASGFLATGRVVGQSLSIALAGAIFTGLGGATAGALLAAGPQGGAVQANVATLQHTFVTSFHAAFLVCAGIAAVGIFTSLVRGAEQPEED